MVGRKILDMLYTNNALNEAEGVGAMFVDGFRKKLVEMVDDENLLMEYGIAAALDVRQAGLGKWK